MPATRSCRPLVGLASLFLVISALPALAATPEEVTREIEGIDDPAPGPGTAPLSRATAAVPRMIPAGGALLIPESTNDRVMAFDPTTGDLLNPDFIPSDPTNLSTPIQAILSASGNSILVSDQLNDAVQEYDLDGNYIGVFAPAGGVDTSILDNIRGIALRPNGNLLVTVGGGTNADAVAEFDTSGNYLGNFVSNGSAGLNSPFDISEVTIGAGSLSAGEWLVGGITSDAIHRYDSNGAPLANLASMNSFPEQVYQIPSGTNAGNVLVGNFSGTQEGVVELDTNGAVVGIYDPAALGSNRGVYELPNGNILTTNGSGVHEIDRSGTLVESKVTGVSARFITLVPAQPQPPTITTNTGITLNEGAMETIGSSELQADDPDTVNDTLQYVVTAGPSNGQLELTTNPGTPITSFTQAQINANQVVYVHDGSDTTSDSFTFDVQDGSGNNVTGQTFAITVNAVDDGAPILTVNDGISVNQGATATIGSTALQATDADTNDDNLVFAVTSGPSDGQLELTTNPGAPITSFTQAQINTGQVVYVHDNSYVISDSFDFEVQDGSGNNLAGQVFAIAVILEARPVPGLAGFGMLLLALLLSRAGVLPLRSRRG